MDDRWLWRHVDLTLYTVRGVGGAGQGLVWIGWTLRTSLPPLGQRVRSCKNWFFVSPGLEFPVRPSGPDPGPQFPRPRSLRDWRACLVHARPWVQSRDRKEKLLHGPAVQGKGIPQCLANTQHPVNAGLCLGYQTPIPVICSGKIIFPSQPLFRINFLSSATKPFSLSLVCILFSLCLL